MSIDTGGAFGSSSDRGQGSGTWKVLSGSQNQTVLQLSFHSGELYEYRVVIDEEGKTYLNDERYFRTYDGEYAPNCY